MLKIIKRATSVRKNVANKVETKKWHQQMWQVVGVVEQAEEEQAKEGNREVSWSSTKFGLFHICFSWSYLIFAASENDIYQRLMTSLSFLFSIYFIIFFYFFVLINRCEKW